MRILQITECPAGGVLRYLVDLCWALAEQSVEVDVIYSLRPETPSNLSSLFPPNVRLHYLRMCREILPREDLAALLSLTKFLRSHRPDFVHAHSSKAGFLSRWAARLVGLKNVLYTPHGYSFLRTDVSLAKRRLYLTLEKIASLAGGMTVASSPNEFEIARKNSLGQITKLYHAVPILTEEVTPREPNPDFLIIGTSGRLTPQKNPMAFLEACLEIKKRLPTAAFLWIGDGELRERFDYEAKRNGVNVFVTGWLDPHEALSKVKNLDLYLHTALWEAWPPYTILEAMAAGVPVVALSVPGITDNISGAIELAENPREMALIVSEIISSRAVWHKKATAGLNVIKREFSMERFKQEVKDLYRLP